MKTLRRERLPRARLFPRVCASIPFLIRDVPTSSPFRLFSIFPLRTLDANHAVPSLGEREHGAKVAESARIPIGDEGLLTKGRQEGGGGAQVVPEEILAPFSPLLI